MPQKLSAISAVLILSCALAGQQATPAATDITADEYQVYAAAVDWFHHIKKSRQPLVADHTSTFACGKVCNGMRIGGCNGMRGADETPAQRLTIVRGDLPRITATVSADFEKNNQQCSAIDAKLPAKAGYGLFGQTADHKLPESWDSPDYFFFSRVSFNTQHTLALIYIGFMSGRNADDSEGKYFVFGKTGDVWAPTGSSDVWKLQP